MSRNVVFLENLTSLRQHLIGLLKSNLQETAENLTITDVFRFQQHSVSKHKSAIVRHECHSEFVCDLGHKYSKSLLKEEPVEVCYKRDSPKTAGISIKMI